MKALILRAPGINRDRDAAAACELVGMQTERIHINRLAEGGVQLRNYDLLIVPGGFSYGDHLGAGKLLAIDLIHRLDEQLATFVADGRPVLGICNGFQVLVKAGILPGWNMQNMRHESGTTLQDILTLTENSSARFECRWVHLIAEPTSRCIFTRGIEQPIEIPVAHGEGRLMVKTADTLEKLRADGQIALRYVTANGTTPSYPADPNGSVEHIAGICNAQGNVLGLMPHPEDAVLPQQHPRWTREPWRSVGDGLIFFQNAARYIAGL